MKKAIIYVCLCGKVQRFDEWLILSPELMTAMWEKVKKEKYEIVLMHTRKCDGCK